MSERGARARTRAVGLGGSGAMDVGCTNLFQAVMRSDTAALEQLLAGDRASAINQPNAAGLTPLMLAIERDRPVSRQFLEDHGATHLCAQFDRELVQRVAARQSAPMEPAVRLQVLELELRHPEQRQASLRRLLSYSGGTVEEVSRLVDRHAETAGVGAQAETAHESAAAAVSKLRCLAPKGHRLRLQGARVTEGLHMVDTQELLDALADPQANAAAQTGGTDGAKHDQMASRRASVCKYSDPGRARLAELDPEPEKEPSFEAGWFPESEEQTAEENMPVRASHVADCDRLTAFSSSGEEEDERGHRETERNCNKSIAGTRPVSAKATTTAAGKMKNYSKVQSRVDARLRRSRSDSSDHRPRLPIAVGSWYPSVAHPDLTANPTPGGKDCSKPGTNGTESHSWLVGLEAPIIAAATRRGNPNVSAASFERVPERSTRPSSAGSIAMMNVIRSASDLNLQRRTVTTPPTPVRRTVSPAASEPNSPTPAGQGVAKIIGEGDRCNQSLAGVLGSRNAEPQPQQQQQQQQQQQHRLRHEELTAEVFLTEMRLKQRRSSAVSEGQSGHAALAIGAMMPLAQRAHRTQHAQEQTIREHQLENYRRKQREKTMAAALPKKSRRTSQRSHSAHQKPAFCPAQTWSGTMLAW